MTSAQSPLPSPPPIPSRLFPPSPSQIIVPMPNSNLQIRFPFSSKYRFESKSTTSFSTFYLTHTFLAGAHPISAFFLSSLLPVPTQPIITILLVHYALTTNHILVCSLHSLSPWHLLQPKILLIESLKPPTPYVIEVVNGRQLYPFFVCRSCSDPISFSILVTILTQNRKHRVIDA